MTDELLKRCSHCKDDKPLAAFSKNKMMADGHHHYCKVCAKESRTKTALRQVERLLKQRLEEAQKQNT